MKGYVQKILTRTWGDKTFYSFTIKGEEGFFNVGSNPPPCELDNQVEFEFEISDKGYKNVQLNTFKVLKRGSEVLPVRAAGTFARWGKRPTGEGATKEKYWEDKAVRDVEVQKKIQKQSSRNSAIAVASMLLEAGAVKLPEGPGKRYDIIVALVQEWFDKFEAQINGEELAETAEEEEITTTTPTEDGSSWEAA